MNKGNESKKKSNEELVALYINEGNTEAFEELMRNTEGLRITLARKYFTACHMDQEDLIQEGAMEMYKKLNLYDPEKAQFSTWIYSVIDRYYQKLSIKANALIRGGDTTEVSFDSLNSGDNDPDNEDTGRGNSLFSVECDDFAKMELFDLMERLNLSEKERIVARFLVRGWEKKDIGIASGMSNSMVCVLSKRIGKKMILAGAVV